MEQVAVRLDAETLAKLDALVAAAADGPRAVTRSDVLRLALVRYLNRRRQIPSG